MKYDKKPIDTAEQVHRLEQRGLLIDDKKLAEQYLHNISYYRLRAYTYPFQNNEEGCEHIFLRDDISFEDIIIYIALTAVYALFCSMQLRKLKLPYVQE